MNVYDQTRVPEVLGGTITLVVLAAISVVARIASRRISAANFWWDDWIIFVAMVLDIGLGIGYWLMVSKGRLGRHTVAYGGPVDDDTLEEFYKILLAIQVLYFSTAVAIKTSLILLYYRIFGVIRWFRYLLAAVWVICALYFMINLLVAIFECKPVAFYWNHKIPGGTCIDENQFYRWNGVANLIIDFMIWSLTLPVIWRLQLNTKQKLSLSGIFLLGLLACIASIVRVIAFNQVLLPDITWTLVNVATWTTIEQSIGVLCANLTTLGPLFGRLLSNIKHVKSKGSSGGSDPEAAKHSDTVPLSDYSSSSRKTTGKASLLDTTLEGFSRLDEGADVNVVRANVTRLPSDGRTPAPKQGILMEKSLEQRFDMV